MEEVVKNITESQPIVQPLVGKPSVKKNFPLINVILALVVIVLGVGAGWGIAKVTAKTSTNGSVVVGGKTVETVSTATEEGVKDASAFKDTATGQLMANDGKITTEGSHILIRPGGVSQNVYLTSSVVDLDKYVGKNVQVWGQTNTARKAGWLMDVGRVKVVQ